MGLIFGTMLQRTVIHGVFAGFCTYHLASMARTSVKNHMVERGPNDRHDLSLSELLLACSAKSRLQKTRGSDWSIGLSCLIWHASSVTSNRARSTWLLHLFPCHCSRSISRTAPSCDRSSHLITRKPTIMPFNLGRYRSGSPMSRESNSIKFD